MLKEPGAREDRIYVAALGAAWLLPCKVASSSIRRALRAAQDLPLPPDRLTYLDKGAVPAYPVRLAFVRHPLTRLESCWADKFVLRPQRGKPFLADFAALGFEAAMDFLAFVHRVCEIPDHAAKGDGKHFRSQAFDLTLGGALLPNWTGRFERLTEDWAKLQRFVRETTADAAGSGRLPQLQHLRHTDKSRIRWTPAARAAAIERYARDFETFGYEP